MNNSPEQIFAQFEEAAKYKAALGKRGLFEQGRMNERFYVGDQWHGAAVGSERPLVRHNVVKRIGDYKISQLTASPVSVKYSAEGVSQNRAVSNRIKSERQALCEKGSTIFSPLSSENETALMISALNSYRETVANRLGLETLVELALRDAYIKGTGIVYTYFDPAAETGLYADCPGGTPILGDIVCERLAVEDVYFGDPHTPHLQRQPFIILVEEKSREEFFLMAERFGVGKEAARRAVREEGERVRVFTKLFKGADEAGSSTVFAVQTTKSITLRPAFSLGIRSYPLAVFRWEERDRSAYGDSEVTYIIPNQIAINRMITAGVWSSMSSGMPLMVVNGDLVSGEITNEPGQIIRAFGTPEELASAVRFVTPPDYSAGYTSAVNSLIYNTLTQCGANEAALGDMDASNTSAIIALREAAGQHLNPLKKRYFAFLGDISRVWAEFFFGMYGKRGLKISDEEGVWFFPFDPSRYRSLILSVTVSEKEKSEAAVTALLKDMLRSGEITAEQFVKHLPDSGFSSANLSELKEGGDEDERI